MTLESHPAFLTYLRLIPADTCALHRAQGQRSVGKRLALPPMHPSTPPCRLNPAALPRGRAERRSAGRDVRHRTPRPRPRPQPPPGLSRSGRAANSRPRGRLRARRAEPRPEGPALAASPSPRLRLPALSPSPFCGPADARRLAARRGSVPCFSPFFLKCRWSWELPRVSSAVWERRVKHFRGILMCLFQSTARRLVSQVHCGLKASSSKKQKFCLEMARPSSNMADFREVFAKAKHIAIITGAGVSAESGVPTFRGAGGFWRKWQAQELATPGAFARNPSRVWEFYHYRREVMLSKHPNPAHVAIAECEKRLSKQGRSVVVITQNIDELHRKAGTKHLLEIHGSLFKTRCTSCGNVAANYKSPICPALAGKGAPDPDTEDAAIPVEDLPQCEEDGCNGLLRPHVVWFGEALDPGVLTAVEKELDICDLCLVVGTSSVVYPAAMFAPQVSARGVPVAEFNMETTPATDRFRFHFPGPCGTTLPPALARHETEIIT
uniref:NAD-dependent protein deacylase sirtuin-5, mitochondrial n=1 Tax=Junco hyemalis TaxID=40217 RepID=A0A8C5JKL3_JUNHY